MKIIEKLWDAACRGNIDILKLFDGFIIEAEK